MRFWIDEHAFADGETELLRQALQVTGRPAEQPCGRCPHLSALRMLLLPGPTADGLYSQRVSNIRRRIPTQLLPLLMFP